eukprot:15161677-Ditylum_brightwellii.AAC.1
MDVLKRDNDDGNDEEEQTNNDEEGEQERETEQSVEDAGEGETEDEQRVEQHVTFAPNTPSTPPATPTTRTRSGRISCLPSYLTPNYNVDLQDNESEEREVNNLSKENNIDISLTPEEEKFYAHMKALNEFNMLSIDKE